MDARFPTHYLNDRRILRATPNQFRLFMFGTAWSVTNMTDGHISAEDFYLIPTANEDDAEALVTSGLWHKTDGGYHVADFAKTQTSAATLEASLQNRKDADAERQRKKYQRDKAKGEDPTDPTDPTQTSREDHVSLEGKERQGKERKGKASYDTEVVPKEEEQVDVQHPSSPENPFSSSEDPFPSGLGSDGWPLNLGASSNGGDSGVRIENRWKKRIA